MTTPTFLAITGCLDARSAAYRDRCPFMGTMYFDLSMSLDGFIAGPNVSEELPQGARGEDLR